MKGLGLKSLYWSQGISHIIDLLEHTIIVPLGQIEPFYVFRILVEEKATV